MMEPRAFPQHIWGQLLGGKPPSTETSLGRGWPCLSGGGGRVEERLGTPSPPNRTEFKFTPNLLFLEPCKAEIALLSCIFMIQVDINKK